LDHLSVNLANIYWSLYCFSVAWWNKNLVW